MNKTSLTFKFLYSLYQTPLKKLNFVLPAACSHSRVAALVQLQVALIRVSLPTLVTDVLLAAGVDVPLVRPQVAALAEGLAADVAGVRLLSGVDAQVQLQAVGVVELLVAEAAGERPLFGVCTSV